VTTASRSGPRDPVAMIGEHRAPDRLEAVARLPDRIAFLGFGLIGASIAMAIREAGYQGRLAAWTPAGTGPADGRARGLIDEVPASAAGAARDAGLVVLAGPPLAILDAFAGDVSWTGGALVTDVASTKVRILEAANANRLRYVGGHPMAGRETTGVGSATSDLFVDRPWVVVPGEAASDGDVAIVEALAVGTGARPMRLDARAHDIAVAAISHLPLVLSAAMVEAVAGTASTEWSLARALAASGWRDATRLARGDAEMGAGILATNADAVADRVRDVRAVIDAWLAELEGPAGVDAIRERLSAAAAALDREPGA
jgi:prephenate dehydrogenase